MLKAELFELVNAHKLAYSDYVINVLAKQAGHEVLRLPPYHYELKPNELMWTHVKKKVAQNNTHFKMNAVNRL